MTESFDPLDADAQITPRLVDSLYTEAMLLADEARSYFESGGGGERDRLHPFLRVGFACEALKVTTRVMHIIAWLLNQRAIGSGELKLPPNRRAARLGHASDSDPAVVEQLPEAARRLIAASSDLYARVERLDRSSGSTEPPASPARVLLGRIERDFIGQQRQG